MKIIPYSVLAATLLGGAVAPGIPGGAGSGAAVSRVQEDAKSKAASGASEPDQQVAAIPAGTMIYAELSKAVDVKKAKAGDEILARSTLPVLSQGKIVIPNDAKIVGHITEAVPRSSADGLSKLGIRFDQIMMRDGTKASIALTVQAIGTAPLASAKDDQEPTLSLPTDRPPGTNLSGMHAPSSSKTTDPLPAYTPKNSPTLDAGSHGVVGMPDTSLVESKDNGAVIESAKRNVKLDRETELVLRVIAAGDEGAGKP